MPELAKTVIIGGGMAGVAAAYWFRRLCPGSPVALFEKGEGLLQWLRRGGRGSGVLGCAGPETEPAEDDFPRGWPLAGTHLRKWSGQATRDWLLTLGIPLEEAPDGRFWIAAEGEPPGEKLATILEDAGVELRRNFFLESLSAQPRGGFRIWSRDGQQEACQRLCLATGGERNHGMALAGEHGGVDLVPVVPAYLRLKTASPKLGTRLGPMARTARVRCPRNSMEETGMVRISPRGLEGEAVSRLSSRLCEDWKARGYRLSLEVDWIPEIRTSALRADLDSRTASGGRKLLGAEPLYGFGPRPWEEFLRLSRIDPETPWSRLRSRQIQTLLHRLKAHSIAVDGMGLPEGERAWAGGIRPDSLDGEGCRSKVLTGMYFAGEILDLLGRPGGMQENLTWAGGYLAGSAMALDAQSG